MSAAAPPTGARQWLRHYAIYGLGIICLNALSFILVPIYTRRLAPSVYGILEILNRCQEVLSIVVMSGFATAALAFYQLEADHPEKRRAVFSTALYGLVFNAAGLALLLWPFGGLFSEWLFHTAEYAWAVRAFLVIIGMEVIFQAGLVSLQADFRSGTYVAVSVGRFLLGVGASVILVYWLDRGLGGAVAAALVNTGVPAVVCLGYVLAKAQRQFDYGLWKELLKYGAPFIPGSFFLFILNSGDRYFLNAFQGTDVVGIYSVSYKVGSIASFLVLLPFVKIWGSMSVGLALRPEGPTQIARATTYLAAAYCYLGLVLALGGPFLVHTFAGAAYWGADSTIPVIILAYLFWSISVVADTVFYAKKKTQIKPFILLATCALCLGLYALLIPEYGAMGAAWATAIAYAAFAMLTIRVSGRYLPVPYEWRRLATLVGVAAVMYVGGHASMVRYAVPSLLAATAGAAAFPLALLALRFWNTEEQVLFGRGATTVFKHLGIHRTAPAYPKGES